jgi:hypothetical protein
MISPSVGRVLWFFDENHELGNQPKAALVTFVHDDTRLNLAVFTADGHAGAYQNVRLFQEGETFGSGDLPCCTWMPYQIGQAKKHETEIGDEKPKKVSK